jgi:U3 small nucleolar RNA-associated protein 12
VLSLLLLLLLVLLLLLLLSLQEGTIQLVDVGACTVIHSEQVHSGAVWSLALLPDKSGFVSGSADKTIKFWTWAVTTVQQQQPQGAAAGDNAEAAAAGGVMVQQLVFNQMRVLEMADDVLCVRVSPDGKLLAASLLDATIKVYYVDRCVRWLIILSSFITVITPPVTWRCQSVCAVLQLRACMLFGW